MMISGAAAKYCFAIIYVLFAQSEGKIMIRNENHPYKDKVHNLWQLATLTLTYLWAMTSVGQSQIVTKAIPVTLGEYLSSKQQQALIRMGGWTSVQICRNLDQMAQNYSTGLRVMWMKVNG